MPQPAPAPDDRGARPDRPLSALIVGAGFAGLCAALRLREAGRFDFEVIEAEDGVGGTWRVNRYPGAACDVPSALYSFSFEQNPDWSHTYASQAEILAYIEGLTDRHGLRPHLRLGRRVTAATYDEGRAVWAVELDDGQRRYTRALIGATGGLSRPIWPEIPGLDRFAGPRVHTARWRPEVTLAGQRVGLIGTGASAVQVGPAIAGQVGALHVFQRTAHWVMARRDRPRSPALNRLRRALPPLMSAERLARYLWAELRVIGFVIQPAFLQIGAAMATRNLDNNVSDAVLRERLRPRFTFGCKRVLLSDDWYPTLQRPNVRLHDAPILRVEAEGLVLRSEAGAEERVPLDVLVCATGFEAASAAPPFPILGRGGRGLGEAWAGNPEAYRGCLVAGFPNLFLLVGPNTGLGHSSMILMIEAQVRLVLSALERLDTVAEVEVSEAAQQQENTDLQARLNKSVWASGCGAWYVNAQSRNTTLWPGFTFTFAHRTRRLDPRALRPSAPRQTGSSATADKPV